jgi:hypothetical protein
VCVVVTWPARPCALYAAVFVALAQESPEVGALPHTAWPVAAASRAAMRAACARTRPLALPSRLGLLRVEVFLRGAKGMVELDVNTGISERRMGEGGDVLSVDGDMDSWWA